ncbi:MAG: alanine racemase [Lacrimispora sp.]
MKNEAGFKYDLQEYKTPLYVFDTDILAQQVGKIRYALGNDIKLCYAMKANPFVIKDLEALVDSFEVCSPGEFSICERAGINMNKIVMSGVHKASEDMEYALDRYGNELLYTIESLSHWQLLKAGAQKRQLPVRALLRLTSGNQFGMDESLIRQILTDRDNEWISIEGIQYYSGTQKKSAQKLEKELAALDRLCLGLKEQWGFTVKNIEYGPGLPVCYFEEEKNEEDSMLDALAASIKKLAFKGSITLEMGRFIAAPCGFYVTTVVDTKTNSGVPYCIVDGGIHQVNYYGQMLAMKKPPVLHLGNRQPHDFPPNTIYPGGQEKDSEEWTVCGSLCTVSDVLLKQYPFKNLQLGDRLVFQKTGAYSATEGISLFLSRDLPQILLYSSKEGLGTARPGVPTNILNSSQLNALN